MKKLVLCMLSAAALSASAEFHRLAIVQVGDTEALAKGVGKLGELTGSALLGATVAATLPGALGADFFGPARAKTPFGFAFYIEDGAAKPESARLYPVTVTKEAFVADHPGCKEEDGVLRVVEAEADEEEGTPEKATFVAFSKDGQWAAKGAGPSVVKRALEDVGAAGRPMKGDLVRLDLPEDALDQIRKVVEDAVLDESQSQAVVRAIGALKEMAALKGGVSVDENGLSVRCSVVPAKGSELAACGHAALEPDSLAFAPKSSVCAVAVAQDCGTRFANCRELVRILNAAGIATDFLQIDEKPGNRSVLTVDVSAALSSIRGQTNALAQLDIMRLQKDLTAAFGGEDFRAKNPPMGTAIAVKGYESSVTPAERLAKTLPMIAKKKPYSLQVLSLHSLVKAMAPAVLASLDEDARAQAEAALAQLPPEGKGGTAFAGWRENDRLVSMLRISADEFKLFSAGFSAVMAYQMRSAMQQAAGASAKSQKSK